MECAFANLSVNPNTNPHGSDDPYASPPISRSNSNCDGHTNATATTPPQKPHAFSPRNQTTPDCKKGTDEISVAKISGACNLIMSNALEETTPTPTESPNYFKIDDGEMEKMFQKGAAERKIVTEIETLYVAKPHKLRFFDWMVTCCEDPANANPTWASVVGDAGSAQWEEARNNYVSLYQTAQQMVLMEKPFM